MYRQESILAISRLPQTQNNYCKTVLHSHVEYEISSRVLGQPDDPSRVLH
jgi:hypothetical protein